MRFQRGDNHHFWHWNSTFLRLTQSQLYHLPCPPQILTCLMTKSTESRTSNHNITCIEITSPTKKKKINSMINLTSFQFNTTINCIISITLSCNYMTNSNSTASTMPMREALLMNNKQIHCKFLVNGNTSAKLRIWQTREVRNYWGLPAYSVEVLAIKQKKKKGFAFGYEGHFQALSQWRQIGSKKFSIERKSVSLCNSESEMQVKDQLKIYIYRERTKPLAASCFFLALLWRRAKT